MSQIFKIKTITDEIKNPVTGEMEPKVSTVPVEECNADQGLMDELQGGVTRHYDIASPVDQFVDSSLGKAPIAQCKGSNVSRFGGKESYIKEVKDEMSDAFDRMSSDVFLAGMERLAIDIEKMLRK